MKKASYLIKRFNELRKTETIDYLNGYLKGYDEGAKETSEHFLECLNKTISTRRGSVKNERKITK